MNVAVETLSRIDLVPTAVHITEVGRVIDCELSLDGEITPSQITVQSETRQFQILREPLNRNELFALMNSIAPLPTDDIGDVRFDLEVGLGGFPGFFKEKALVANHARHFSEGWEVVLSHGATLLDSLPGGDEVSGYVATAGRFDRSTIKQALGRISNKEVKVDLLKRYKAGEVIAEPLIIEESKLLLPSTPLTEIHLPGGSVEYQHVANIQHTKNEAHSQTVPISEDEVARAIVLNSNRRIAIATTQRPRQRGIVPMMKWSVGDKPVFQFDQPEVIRPRLSLEKGQITASSLIGAVLLSYLTPEVSKAWPERAGYTKESSKKKKQAMGPLQATLLSVLSSASLMRGSFVQRVETIVQNSL